MEGHGLGRRGEVHGHGMRMAAHHNTNQNKCQLRRRAAARRRPLAPHCTSSPQASRSQVAACHGGTGPRESPDQRCQESWQCQARAFASVSRHAIQTYPMLTPPLDHPRSTALTHPTASTTNRPLPFPLFAALELALRAAEPPDVSRAAGTCEERRVRDEDARVRTPGV